MNHLIVYTKKNLSRHIRVRIGETKLGECVQTLSSKNIKAGLKTSTATFVLVGLPEDIGVRANFGRGGAHTAWEPALTNLLNIQSNAFFKGEELLVLGHIDFDDLLKRAQKLDSNSEKGIETLRSLCAEVDKRVAPVIQSIVEAGKIPLVIGGGHNNAYGNMKGVAMGLAASGKLKNTSINCINCDAHSDFRALEGRHSGNGFSYAFQEKFLDKYAIVGLHENYNSANVLKELKKHAKKIQYSFLEDILIREKTSFNKAISNALSFVSTSYYGVELDMDAIENIPSSAKTSSGISANEARKFVSQAAQHKKVAYLHITEAAPILSHIKTDNKTGKLIAYLLTDFMKSYLKNNKLKSIDHGSIN
jgi:formiminoglutamase